MVVHPWKGYLFFAEAERPARIWRCYTDATNCIVIRNTTLGRPSGMVIDFEENRLCIGDSLLKFIGCMDFNGNNWQTLKIKEPIPVALTILGGKNFFFFC